MKIPVSIIPNAYKISKDVFDKNLSLDEGVKLISNNNEVNTSSARDYIYNFRYLMKGKAFTRTLDSDSMDYFIEHILTDYGVTQLEKSLSALLQHIEYYEGQQNTKMVQMRIIYNKYSEQVNTPILISNIEQLIQNINTIEYYLSEGSDKERLESAKLIKRGTCFISYQIGEEIRFAPSRFLGYVNNLPFKYSTSIIDGRETNKAINSILNSKPLFNSILEIKYLEYCYNLGIKPQSKGGAYGITRKFWKLNIVHDFNINNELLDGFPEGKIVERTHKARERNSKVIEIAKEIFKQKNGKVFCQVCEFDFEDMYGDIGKNFIEGHHTIAVSEMPPDYKTKPEEIAMLCSNCHKMVHKKRPWLTMEELSKLLKR